MRIQPVIPRIHIHLHRHLQRQSARHLLLDEPAHDLLKWYAAIPPKVSTNSKASCTSVVGVVVSIYVQTAVHENKEAVSHETA